MLEIKLQCCHDVHELSFSLRRNKILLKVENHMVAAISLNILHNKASTMRQTTKQRQGHR